MHILHRRLTLGDGRVLLTTPIMFLSSSFARMRARLGCVRESWADLGGAGMACAVSATSMMWSCFAEISILDLLSRRNPCG